MTKTMTVTTTGVATSYAATALCRVEPRAAFVCRLRGSWRRVDSGASAFASVKHAESATAAGRPDTTVNVHAPQAIKRHMTRKNGVKGSLPWRVPV